MKHSNLSPNRERGAALVIALIMLVILTIIGVAAIEGSAIQERIAGAALERNRAFQAAEAGLRAGENWIQDQTQRPIPSNGLQAVTDLYVMQRGTATANSPWWNDLDEDWWTDNAWDSNLALTNTRLDPVLVVEEMDSVCDSSEPTLENCVLVYRVTSQAWGQGNADITLQSYYARRY